MGHWIGSLACAKAASLHQVTVVKSIPEDMRNKLFHVVLLVVFLVQSQSCFKVKSSSLNLRALPSASSQLLASVANGEVLTSLKKESADHNWVLIRSSAGVQAWVNKDFVSSITCPANSGSSSSGGSTGGDCGPYGKAARRSIAGNGGRAFTVVRIAPGDLTDIRQQDNTMEVRTACGFHRLKMAARAAGHRITINSGFRTLARQRFFYGCFLTKRCNGGADAAVPGTSKHGIGRALDLALTPAALSWMNRNAQRFGFVRTVRSETWHWEYIPGSRKPFPY